MPAKVLQIILLWLRRHFGCWHEWRVLKHYGIPGEPLLAQCEKCKWITGAIL